ncbi:MAG: hypothetical protein R6U93_01140 [Dehalococcoidia bacterium]
MKRIQATIICGLLLFMLVTPQLAAAEPYSISLVPYSGVYDDLIEARVSVESAGTYHICWGDPPSAETKIASIAADSAGNFSADFNIPEAKRGINKVYLTNDGYGKLAEADFEVFPTARIAPTTGPVGTEVSIWGYGFSAGQSVQIRYRDQVAKTVTASSMGSWDTSYTIPPSPSGSHLFTVPDDKIPFIEVCCSMGFRVTPEILVDPDEGTVGQTVKVSGTGFASNEKAIRVTLDGEVVAEDISADANGSWTADIIIPPRKGGTSIIDASGFSTMARDVPDVEFVVGAGILVEPSSAYVGDTIAVAGCGFATLETGVKITLGDTAVDTGVITVDGDGCWETSFVLPTSTYGPHTVSASGDVTKPALTATLNTLAIVEVSPAEGVPGDSVTLTGSGFPANQALTVTFANRAVAEDVRSLANGDLSATVSVPANPVGKVLMTATGGGAQASADFTVKAKVLPTPQLTSPQEGRTLRSKEITFEWGKVTAGSDITYTLEISTTAAFSVIAWSESGIKTTSFQLPKEEALDRGEYYWRVRAVDEFGNESPWSDPRSFTVAPIPTWVWVIVGVVVATALIVIAYREEKFKVPD